MHGTLRVVLAVVSIQYKPVHPVDTRRPFSVDTTSYGMARHINVETTSCVYGERSVKWYLNCCEMVKRNVKKTRFLFSISPMSRCHYRSEEKFEINMVMLI